MQHWSELERCSGLLKKNAKCNVQRVFRFKDIGGNRTYVMSLDYVFMSIVNRTDVGSIFTTFRGSKNIQYLCFDFFTKSQPLEQCLQSVAYFYILRVLYFDRKAVCHLKYSNLATERNI